MPERVHAMISGEVQGVGFRYFAMRLAQEMGLKGWVKNNPDGTVELETEGDKDKLSEFLKRLKTEHSYAAVNSIETKWEQGKNKYLTFSIKED